ncbi:MORC family CW-type zinc finger protein 3-like [Hemibagrus wyckioides]|uniref:MORC family CW-type zinc finger protein 3-like n=1 Tax=Hemibagrus wyckioides TaxID=337641 RepID=UPI00266D1EC0|nr:MORC family CW-type zinc finger protein 3-like [Hemibagrus wyckioides]
MAAPTNAKIPLSSISPQFLHTNSTSHTWPFSAIAELIDNAYDPDANAKQLWINKTAVKDQEDCLIFMDNGKGMDYDKMHKMLSFGFSNKEAIRGHVPVGLYGNGFKSGSMRLGKDAIVFSKKANTMCVGLLSQTYLELTGAQTVIVPIVMFTKTGQTVSVHPEHADCLHHILKYSLFSTKEELFSEFSVIEGLSTNSSGTRIIIWNLRRTVLGELEFDFMKDPNDIRIPVHVYESTRETKKHQNEGGMSVPESEYSLRAYCSILYLKPRMQIIIQGQKVETQFVTKSLAKVFMDTYKPTGYNQKITITFGYNTKTKEHYGIMMYNKNRLIKAYERVACQRKANSTGVGVIGVLECNHLKPTHNKQDFDNTDEYKKTMLNVGYKLEDYCKEVCYRHQKNLNFTEPIEDIAKQPDQTWVQCDDCLKWRKLPDGVDAKKLPKKWFCRMNPDQQFRSCTVEEEPENADDEIPKYEKTYKEYERNQWQEEKNRQQRSFKPRSASKTTHSPTLTYSSLTCAGSRPSVHIQDTPLPITPTRMKRALSQTQEYMDKKKARGNGSVNSILDCLSTSTPSPGTVCSPAMCSSGNDTNKVEREATEIAPMDNSDDVNYKSAVHKEQINYITQTISEEPLNYKVLYMQAREEIKQLQHKLMEQEKAEKELRGKADILEAEKRTLTTYCESLQNDLEDIKRESEKVKLSVEDQSVQTDFPIISKEESATTSTEASNPRTEKDLQFGTQQNENQDRMGDGQENNNTQLCSHRLRQLRQSVAGLLATLVSDLDLQQVDYDSEDIDEILTELINQISTTEAAST